MRWLERLIYLIVAASLGVAGYYGYQMYVETKDAGVEDTQYVSSVLNWSAKDTSTKPAIIMGPKERKQRVQQDFASCEKMLELMVPAVTDQVFNVVWAPDQGKEGELEKRCLKKGPIYVSRGGRYVMPGEPGVFVISGHRDTHFKRFKPLGVGDYTIVNNGKYMFIYQIRGMKKYHESNAPMPEPLLHSDRSSLYLTTCYPIRYSGPAPYRLLYRAELVHKIPSKGFHNKGKRV